MWNHVEIKVQSGLKSETLCHKYHGNTILMTLPGECNAAGGKTAISTLLVPL